MCYQQEIADLVLTFAMSFLLQKRYQFLRGTATVAYGVFHFVAQFGKGLVVTVGLEDGVVAEALGTTLLLGDLSVATAFEEI